VLKTEDLTMLILSRKSSESVVVGKSESSEPLLMVTVLEIRGGSVRLGFEAQADVPVHRLEVWERIHAGFASGNLLGGPLEPEL
jgi:carbon storage regulator